MSQVSQPARPSGHLLFAPRTVCSLPSFYLGLGTSELTGVGDCGYRKSEVCQHVVLRRRPGLSWARPPGMTPSVLFLQGPGRTPVPGFAMLSAGEDLPPHNMPEGYWLH